MSKIDKPHLIQSDIPFGKKNKISQKVVSNKVLISTEYWISEPTRKWIDADVITAKKGYKWVTKWELSKHYIVTEIFDEKEKLVGVYWDITSQVQKINGQYQAYDWYLDVFKISDSRVVILDENELEQAFMAGFISDKEMAVAKRTAQIIYEENLHNR